MDEVIDHNAVILQLQLENEMLRRYLQPFADVQQAVNKIPNMFEQIWRKAVAHKYQVLVGLMVLYWAISIAFMLWDRVVKHE